jgi:hypothetical protein
LAVPSGVRALWQEAQAGVAKSWFSKGQNEDLSFDPIHQIPTLHCSGLCRLALAVVLRPFPAVQLCASKSFDSSYAAMARWMTWRVRNNPAPRERRCAISPTRCMAVVANWCKDTASSSEFISSRITDVSRCGCARWAVTELAHCRNKHLAARVAGWARRREKAHPVATSPSVSDPERWRKRAEKLRAIAADVADPNLRARLFRIADGYDVLAERAEQRAQSAGEGRPVTNAGRDENGA